MRKVMYASALILLISCNAQQGYSVAELEKMASSLRQQELYEESIEMYEQLLNDHTLDTKKRALILYQVATMQKDHLVDFKGALASYTKIKALAPDEKFSGNLNKNMVLCLERLGRSLDASQQTSKAVSLNEDTKDDSGLIIAEIGDQKITLEEVENTFGKLPEEAQKKQQLVQNYIGTIVAARAARRKGLGDDREIKQQLIQMETQLLAQASIREELKDVTIDQADVLNFYNAQKDNYGDSTSFEQVQEKVNKDYVMQKQGAMVNEYIQKLLKADDVKLHLDKIQ